MAKFCRYCGKQIDDGICDCPQSVAAAEAAIRQKVAAAMGGAQEAADAGSMASAVPKMKPTQAAEAAEASQTTTNNAPAGAAGQMNGGAGAQGTGFRSAEAQQAAQAAGVVGRQLSTMFVNIIASPVNAMRQAIADPNKLPQYLMAIAYALLMILLVDVGCRNEFIEDDVLLGTGVRMALGVLAVRAVYAAAAYALLKKYNPVLRLRDLIGVFSMTFAYDFIILVATILSFRIGFYELAIALLFFWGIMDALIAYLATWIISGENAAAAFRSNLLIQLVLTIVLVFVGRSMVASFASDVLGAAFLSAFY